MRLPEEPLEGYATAACFSSLFQPCMGVAGLDCGRWIWHILDQRENDETLPKHPDDGDMHYDAGYWGVQANDYAVRHVRIVQVAANANGNRDLSCGGLELYGALQEL